MTKLDIKKAFLNIRLKESDIPKAAFVTENGHYEPNRMLFGLCNAPATMQSVMNDGVRKLVDTGNVEVYTDDLCIFTEEAEYHIELLNETLHTLCELGLRTDIAKCIFMSSSIPFLGLIVSSEGLSIDPDRTAAIDKYPRPRNKTEMRSFLGLTSYYRKYIKDYSKIARPLTDLTRQTAEFTWTDDCETAMNKTGAWRKHHY